MVKYEELLATLDEIIKSKHITAAHIYDSPYGGFSLSEILALTIAPDNVEEMLTTDLTQAVMLEGIAADKKLSLLQLDIEYVK